MLSLPTDQQSIFTVSQLNREVRLILEQQFGFVWLEGEISNLSQPASGHLYLSLKDSSAQIRCAMFRGRNRNLKFKPKNGAQVVVHGSLGLYEARGDFQLIIEQMEPVGEGLLQRRFEETKEKLKAQGLFAESQKLTLPQYPNKIGVITSATGAAIQDVLHVLSRRYPLAPIIVYPTAVQGIKAADEIAATIRTADKRSECDVLLLVRGGGSLEDLWPFNEEIVAHAIHQCSLPIISGIGHEIDFTIADMVADVRAPTPSAAAEIATPDSREQLQNLNGLMQSLCDCIKQQLQFRYNTTQQLHHRLLNQHPQRQLAQKIQRVDELEKRLEIAINHTTKTAQSGLQLLLQSLNTLSPLSKIEFLSQKIKQYQDNLINNQCKLLDIANARLDANMRALNGVSPLATLKRGYAVITNKEDNIMNTLKKIKTGDTVTATVIDGKMYCRVEKIKFK